MLSYIKWNIKHIETNSAIILTNSWVWYEIIINELIYSQIHSQNEIELFIFHSITDNWQSLFWFLTIEDRTVFKELIKISWVWWRVAQTILSIWVERLKKAIINDDKKTLESIKWVWKKMAEKIVLELKDKDYIKVLSVEEKHTITSNIPLDIKKQVSSTLTAMWYNPQNIEKVLNSLPENLTTINDIIPYVIKNI